MFEFGKAAEMRVASLGIFELIECDTRDFPHVDTGKPRVWLCCEHTMHRKRDRLAKRFMAGLEVDCSQHDRCIGEMAGQRAMLPWWRISGLTQPALRRR